MIWSNLTKCKLENLTDKELEIRLVNGNGFNFNMLNNNRSVIETVCHDFFQRKIQVKIIQQKENQDNVNRQQIVNQKEMLRQEAMNHPMVNEVKEIFGGKLIDVKILF